MQTIIIKRPGTDTGWPASGEPITLAQIYRLLFVA
jgi:hypothetical protein